jgi:prepilin peptidase CpaA
MPDAVPAAALLLLPLAVAAWHDIALRRIPDGIVLLAAGMGAGLRAAEGPAALGGSLLVALAVFALLLIPFARGWLGGGDVKLLSALAIAIPPAAAPGLLVATTLAGGVLALLYLSLRLLPAPAPAARRVGFLPRRILAVERARIRRGAPLPYGLAIAAGAVFVILGGGA